ncbi:ANTAR domain-containing protein [Micromonospora endophytica]|uniref:Antitermination regulator n=1 Tax=Micromonospora endophytica TaxID=515350 RepID=A0A2W2C7J7_9ACTN|nr:GAF and ANTAR domain-containing protein [Micromonospora endophytica]PZF93720.1 antitermination regulator [Micromonospora endophytica]RIW41760.1 ANTAR domain-containing protein [Micromonospora endophytica]BCJ62961.1 transcriptional regulator [Micromonospora endophytica]
MNLEASPPFVETLGVLETAALLRELTAGLLALDDFDEALAALVRVTRDAMVGVSWCGFTALRAGEPAGAAASDARLSGLDDLRCGPDTPAMDAIRRREMVRAENLAKEDRWPDWTARALQWGVRGVISAPVDIDEQVIGAVNLYADEADALRTGHQLTAMLLAEHAGLLLAAVRDRQRRAAQAGEQDAALLGDGVISQAVGVIMTQRGCPAEDALEVLRSAATSLSIPLREVAERLVSTVSRPRDN